MTRRPEKGRGLFYHRDSEGHSALVPPQYVEWARGEAARLGVAFSGTPAAIAAMIAGGRSADGDLFLDYGVSGNLLRRPGLDALRARALGDPTVTHLFFPRRDRIARPEHPADGMAIERELRTAGLTLVFMDGMTLAPTPRGGEIDLGEGIVGWIDYHASGRFRRELAEKLIHAKIRLARGGFSIGGEPPYGFRRWLCAEDGTPKRELEEHERVKLPGHHVVWRPTATDELRVVQRILELIETTPAARVARLLNDEGVPSPSAGRVRVRGGVKAEVSGQWTQNTVKNIVTHPLLVAVCEYGKRSEGDTRRFTPDGPRALGEDDYHPDGKLKTVANPDDRVIRTPAKSEPVTTTEKFHNVREVIERRGQHLKGKARTRGQAPNPLGGRIYDLNCGWLMYRYPKRGKWCYVCGLYQCSEAKCCRHNVVQGETATRFVLDSLRQRVLNPSTLAKLKARLGELATAERGDDPARRQLEADRAELAALRRKIEKVGENMALAESREERDATAAVFRKLKGQASALDQRVKAHCPTPPGDDPQRQVEAALGTLDRLSESLAAGHADWSAVGGAFTQTNAKLYLRFAAVEKGRQTLNVPAGGVVTFGSAPPPGRLYTGPTDRPIIRRMLAAGESVTASPGCGTPGDSDAGQDVTGSATVQRGTRRCSRPPAHWRFLLARGHRSWFATRAAAELSVRRRRGDWMAELFGNPADFAIEAGVEPDLRPGSAVWGHMRVLCGGAALGDIEERSCALYPSYLSFGALASRIDRLWAEEFEGLDDGAIFDMLYGLLYGGREYTSFPVPASLFGEDGERNWTVWGCFDFLNNWGEQFDGFTSFIVCPPGGPARVLSKSFIGHPGPAVSCSPAGVVAAVSGFRRWFEEQELRLRGVAEPGAAADRGLISE